MTNQSTPWGSLTYNQIGQWEDGTPRYEAKTQLSPEQQQLFNTWQTTQGMLGDIGQEQTGRIGELLGTPVDLSNEAVEGRLFELGSARLNPMFQQQGSELETSLLNKGIRPGTPAYEAEMTRFQQGKNDAFNNLVLQGRGQSVQELLTERNQPINEITALLSGSQVNTPQFQSTPNTPVSGTDYAGLAQNAYNQENAAYQAKMGGLFGLGGQAVGGWARAGFPMPSDSRLKDIIAHVATTDKGIKLYSFRYNDKGLATFGMPTYVHIGVIAQEVKDLRPDCISESYGFMLVDYDKLFTE